jgi:hypothetical protein
MKRGRRDGGLRDPRGATRTGPGGGWLARADTDSRRSDLSAQTSSYTLSAGEQSTSRSMRGLVIGCSNATRRLRGFARRSLRPLQYNLNVSLHKLVSYSNTNFFTVKCVQGIRVSILSQPHAHNPRSSRSCASIAVASGKRGVISISKGTGRLSNS